MYMFGILCRRQKPTNYFFSKSVEKTTPGYSSLAVVNIDTSCRCPSIFETQLVGRGICSEQHQTDMQSGVISMRCEATTLQSVRNPFLAYPWIRIDRFSRTISRTPRNRDVNISLQIFYSVTTVTAFVKFSVLHNNEFVQWSRFRSYATPRCKSYGKSEVNNAFLKSTNLWVETLFGLAAFFASPWWERNYINRSNITNVSHNRYVVGETCYKTFWKAE